MRAQARASAAPLALEGMAEELIGLYRHLLAGRERCEEALPGAR
jgi:hypothetical protein